MPEDDHHHLITRLQECLKDHEGLIVREYMSTDVAVIGADKTVADAANEMINRRVHGLPVVEDERLVGIISTFDLLLVIVLKDFRGYTPVKNIMAKDPITIYPDAPIAEALHLMVEKNIRRLPVVEKGVLVGMLSLYDLARIL